MAVYYQVQVNADEERRAITALNTLTNKGLSVSNISPDAFSSDKSIIDIYLTPGGPITVRDVKERLDDQGVKSLRIFDETGVALTRDSIYSARNR